MHCADDEIELYNAMENLASGHREGVHIFQGRSKDFSPFLKILFWGVQMF